MDVDGEAVRGETLAAGPEEAVVDDEVQDLLAVVALGEVGEREADRLIALGDPRAVVDDGAGAIHFVAGCGVFKGGNLHRGEGGGGQSGGEQEQGGQAHGLTRNR